MDAAGIVDVLCEEKRAGLSFDEAWQVALGGRPLLHMDVRDGEQLTIDVATDEEAAESPMEFLRRVCADAWHGRRPELAYLGKGLDVALVAELEDRSSFARKKTTPALMAA